MEERKNEKVRGKIKVINNDMKKYGEGKKERKKKQTNKTKRRRIKKQKLKDNEETRNKEMN